jgi:hypothetical protein
MSANPRLLIVFAATQFVLFPIPIVTVFWTDQIGTSLTDVMLLQGVFSLARARSARGRLNGTGRHVRLRVVHFLQIVHVWESAPVSHSSHQAIFPDRLCGLGTLARLLPHNWRAGPGSSSGGGWRFGP